jgi:hypothetical protein
LDRAVEIAVERRSAMDDRGERGFEALGSRAVAPLLRHVAASGGDATFLSALERALSHEDYRRVEQALDGKKETALHALHRAGGEPRTRVYLLYVGNDEFPADAMTVSRSGGRPPLPDRDVPTDDDGEPLEHIFTLDLHQFPDLAGRYPGNRALSFFCPEPKSGDRYDECRLIPVAECPEDPSDGQPIAVVPLEVSEALFDEAEGDLLQLRHSIFNADGHVIGAPIWIQDGETGHGEFIMQVNQGLGDLNLGDLGSLYVFERGFVFQCH